MNIGRVRRNNNRDYCIYKDAIIADSGLMKNDVNSLEYINFLRSIGCYENSKLIWTGEMGYKKRTATIYDYASKLYSADVAANNMAQATELNQPFYSGNIAPNEKLCIKNNNGLARSLTHPAIAFQNNETWSLTVAVNNNYDGSYAFICGESTILSSIGFRNFTNYIFCLYVNNVFVPGTINYSNLLGKTIIISVIYDGTGCLIYINGVFKEKIININSFIFKGLGNYILGTNNLKGRYYNYRIQSGAMSASQITAENNFLRAKYPEIESVVIGTQTWATSNFEAVCTPVGNVIPEIQLAAATEKVVDTNYNDPTKWFCNTGWSVSGGRANFNGTINEYINTTPSIYATVGKWYKVSLEIISITGTIQVNYGGVYSNYTTIGIKTVYLKAINTLSFIVYGLGTTIATIDNASVQELGWANSTEIYNTVYAATSGTTAQKEYAALKEAAMWCYYNNDPILGSVYGKLYNWYAVKLFDLDFSTAGFGWHVPTSTEMTTLQTYLGGVSVAGGNLKMTGTNYCNPPNTGSSNNSGFTALICGRRSATGLDLYLKDYTYFYTIDVYGCRLDANTADFRINLGNVAWGYSFRILKN